MEQQTKQQVYQELLTIQETLRKVERDVDRLTALVEDDGKTLQREDHLAFIGLGASGLSDVADRHDHYVGKAIADEHLH